jgi:hypothetical protein
MTLDRVKELYSKAINLGHHANYFFIDQKDRIEKQKIDRNFGNLRFGNVSDFYTDYMKARSYSLFYHSTELEEVDTQVSSIPRIISHAASYGKL